MQDHVDHIASLLYEGILSPSDWRAGLDAIRNCMQGGLFYHFAVDKSSLAIVSSHQNVEVPADKVRDYELHHARDDERMPIVMGLAVGEMMFDHEHFSARELSNSFIYSDWLPSIGYRHTMCLPLHDDGTTREFLSIIRPSDHHAYNTDDRRFMEHLLPHLSRAARLRSQSTHLACQAALGTAALDALPQCVALLDTHHRVRYLNNAARLALDNSPYLAVRHGQLYCKYPQAQERLCASVAAACRQDDTARAGILQCAPDTTIHVLPLKANHPPGSAAACPTTLLAGVGPSQSMATHGALACGSGIDRYRSPTGTGVGHGQVPQGFRGHPRMQLAYRTHTRQKPVAQNRLPPAGGTGSPRSVTDPTLNTRHTLPVTTPVVV